MKRIQHITVLGLSVLVLLFYAATAFRNTDTPHLWKYPAISYHLLADAFIKGQTSLLIKPDKELRHMKDPYDPHQNRPHRLHDASLYKNKYYLYYGPTPALTVFAPFRLLTGRHLPVHIAHILFAFGGFIWGVLFLRLLMCRYLNNTPFWMFCIAVICMALNTVAPYCLQYPTIYQSAILCGYFFFLGALYWLASGCINKKIVLWRLSLGSLFMGLAFGSRPPLIVLSIFILPILVMLGIRTRSDCPVIPGKTLAFAFICTVVPFCLCGILLAIYNHVRFDSFCEFGMKYVVGVTNFPKTVLPNKEYIRPNLYFELFRPALINGDPPFIHMVSKWRFYPWTPPGKVFLLEPVAGIITNMPLLTMGFLLPVCLLFQRVRRQNGTILWIVAMFLVAGLGIAFLEAYFMFTATMRYAADEAVLLLVAGLLIWFTLDNALKNNHRLQWALRAFVSLLIAFGWAFGIAISLSRHFNYWRTG